MFCWQLAIPGCQEQGCKATLPPAGIWSNQFWGMIQIADLNLTSTIEKWSLRWSTINFQSWLEIILIGHQLCIEKY